jgi:hypothetical protein
MSVLSASATLASVHLTQRLTDIQPFVHPLDRTDVHPLTRLSRLGPGARRGSSRALSLHALDDLIRLSPLGPREARLVSSVIPARAR